MINPTADLRRILANDLGETVTLWNGATVKGAPGVASTEDVLTGGESLVAGKTRTLRMVSEDVVGLVPGKKLTWGGKTWTVLQTTLRGNGTLTVAFLGAV